MQNKRKLLSRVGARFPEPSVVVASKPNENSLIIRCHLRCFQGLYYSGGALISDGESSNRVNITYFVNFFPNFVTFFFTRYRVTNLTCHFPVPHKSPKMVSSKCSLYIYLTFLSANHTLEVFQKFDFE